MTFAWNFLTAIIALMFVVIIIVGLGFGIIALINWTIFTVVEWFDKRRKR